MLSNSDTKKIIPLMLGAVPVVLMVILAVVFYLGALLPYVLLEGRRRLSNFYQVYRDPEFEFQSCVKVEVL